jgi:PIN domain nuclease of toxin-antitoxin system
MRFLIDTHTFLWFNAGIYVINRKSKTPKETKLATRIIGAIQPAKSSRLKQGFF